MLERLEELNQEDVVPLAHCPLDGGLTHGRNPNRWPGLLHRARKGEGWPVGVIVAGKGFGDLARQGEIQGSDVLHHDGLTFSHRNPKAVELVWVGTSANPDIQASARDLVHGCDLARNSEGVMVRQHE